LLPAEPAECAHTPRNPDPRRTQRYRDARPARRWADHHLDKQPEIVTTGQRFGGSLQGDVTAVTLHLLHTMSGAFPSRTLRSSSRPLPSTSRRPPSITGAPPSMRRTATSSRRRNRPTSPMVHCKRMSTPPWRSRKTSRCTSSTKRRKSSSRPVDPNWSEPPHQAGRPHPARRRRSQVFHPCARNRSWHFQNPTLLGVPGPRKSMQAPLSSNCQTVRSRLVVNRETIG
jgi:hypothetical protein